MSTPPTCELSMVLSQVSFWERVRACLHTPDINVQQLKQVFPRDEFAKTLAEFMPGSPVLIHGYFLTSLLLTVFAHILRELAKKAAAQVRKHPYLQSDHLCRCWTLFLSAMRTISRDAGSYSAINASVLHEAQSVWYESGVRPFELSELVELIPYPRDANTEAALERLTHQNGELRQEIDRCQSALESAHKKLAKAQEQLADADREREEKHQLALDSAHGKIAELQQQLEEAVFERGRETGLLEQQLAEAVLEREKEVNLLQFANDESMDKCSQLSAELAVLQARYNEATAQAASHQQASARTTELELRVAALQSQCADHAAEKEELKTRTAAEKEELETGTVQLVAELEKLKTMTVQLAAELEELKTTTAAEKEELAAELEELAERNSELEEQIDKFQELSGDNEAEGHQQADESEAEDHQQADTARQQTGVEEMIESDLPTLQAPDESAHPAGEFSVQEEEHELLELPADELLEGAQLPSVASVLAAVEARVQQQQALLMLPVFASVGGANLPLGDKDRTLRGILEWLGSIFVFRGQFTHDALQNLMIVILCAAVVGEPDDLDELIRLLGNERLAKAPNIKYVVNFLTHLHHSCSSNAGLRPSLMFYPPELRVPEIASAFSLPALLCDRESSYSIAFCICAGIESTQEMSAMRTLFTGEPADVIKAIDMLCVSQEFLVANIVQALSLVRDETQRASDVDLPTLFSFFKDLEGYKQICATAVCQTVLSKLMFEDMVETLPRVVSSLFDPETVVQTFFMHPFLKEITDLPELLRLPQPVAATLALSSNNPSTRLGFPPVESLPPSLEGLKPYMQVLGDRVESNQFSSFAELQQWLMECAADTVANAFSALPMNAKRERVLEYVEQYDPVATDIFRLAGQKDEKVETAAARLSEIDIRRFSAFQLKPTGTFEDLWGLLVAIAQNTPDCKPAPQSEKARPSNKRKAPAAANTLAVVLARIKGEPHPNGEVFKAPQRMRKDIMRLSETEQARSGLVTFRTQDPDLFKSMWKLASAAVPLALDLETDEGVREALAHLYKGASERARRTRKVAGGEGAPSGQKRSSSKQQGPPPKKQKTVALPADELVSFSEEEEEEEQEEHEEEDDDDDEDESDPKRRKTGPFDVMERYQVVNKHNYDLLKVVSVTSLPTVLASETAPNKQMWTLLALLMVVRLTALAGRDPIRPFARTGKADLVALAKRWNPVLSQPGSVKTVLAFLLKHAGPSDADLVNAFKQVVEDGKVDTASSSLLSLEQLFTYR